MSQLKTKYIAANAVTNDRLAQVPAMTLKGNNGSGVANSLDLSVSQVLAMLGTSASSPSSSILIWTESGVQVPTPAVEFGMSIYGYAAKASQSLVATLQVPSSYTAGSPIKLYNRVYSPDSSGTLLFQTVTTLIRTGTDTLGSTTNQRTSTNTSLTLAVGTVNVPQAVTYDLTDSTGKINSVSVSIGDLILISLTRATTDTATSIARCIVYASNLTFM